MYFSQITPFPIHTDPDPAALMLCQAGCSSLPHPGAASPSLARQRVAPAQQNQSTGCEQSVHHVGRWRPGWREEFILTAHLSCPPAHCSRRADNEQTSHRTSSNFLLSFILRARALRAPLHHFSYESSKNVSCSCTAWLLQGQVHTSAAKANVLPRLPARRASEEPAGQPCARGRPARHWGKKPSRQPASRFLPTPLLPRCP